MGAMGYAQQAEGVGAKQGKSRNHFTSYFIEAFKIKYFEKIDVHTAAFI